MEVVTADIGRPARHLGDGAVKITGAESAQCHLDRSHPLEAAGGSGIQFFCPYNHHPNVGPETAVVKSVLWPRAAVVRTTCR